MDPRFHDYVIDQLETLLSDMRAGLQPSNIAFAENVIARLRKDYDQEYPARISC